MGELICMEIRVEKMLLNIFPDKKLWGLDAVKFQPATKGFEMLVKHKAI